MITPSHGRRSGRRGGHCISQTKTPQVHRLHLPSTGLTLDEIEDERPRIFCIILILLVAIGGFGLGVRGLIEEPSGEPTESIHIQVEQWESYLDM